MTTPVTTKEIRILIGFAALTDEGLVTQCNSVTMGLGAPNRQITGTPPVTIPVFSAAVTTFTTDIAAAVDGGAKAITAKNKQRKLVIQMLRQLAVYVEANCNDDLAILATTGFVAASTTRGIPQPLGQPDSPKVVQGVSGQQLVTITSVDGATSYDLQVAVVTAGVPGAWTAQLVTNLVRATPVNGLTPGTTYAFQVRALGKLGYSPWSDSATRMTT